MRYIKMMCMVFAADIFALFVSFTLAGSSALPVKIISAVCGTGILAVLLINCAADEMKKNMKEKHKSSIGSIFLMGVSASAACLISWVLLMLSVKRRFEFYRIHKLINGFFIQILNFIEPDASSSALSTGEVMSMLPLAFLPAAIVITTCTLTVKGMIFPENS